MQVVNYQSRMIIHDYCFINLLLKTEYDRVGISPGANRFLDIQQKREKPLCGCCTASDVPLKLHKMTRRNQRETTSLMLVSSALQCYTMQPCFIFPSCV